MIYKYFILICHVLTYLHNYFLDFFNRDIFYV
jgi:hypothetical protein